MSSLLPTASHVDDDGDDDDGDDDDDDDGDDGDADDDAKILLMMTMMIASPSSIPLHS